jgi:superfamily II DNA or RNA helicase
LILVHRKDLLYQTVARVQGYLGEPVGSIGDTRWDPKRCTVGMVQTLGRLSPDILEFLRRQVVFIADESHHLPAATFTQVAKHCPAYVRVAISATPFKANDLVHAYRLQGTTGALLYEQSAAHLVTDGHLAPVHVEYIQVQTPSTIRSAPYQQAYTEGIVQNHDRNHAIVERAQQSAAQGRHVLILVTRLEHGATLSTMLACPFLSGKESSETRQRAAQHFQQGTPPILVVTSIWDEGVDAPEIDHVILAGGGKSEIQVLQRIGRGMRRKTDGRGLLVTDFLDLMHRQLTKHSRDRFLACRAAQFTTALRTD